MFMERLGHYIEGEWVASTTAEIIDVVNPSTEAVIGRVSLGGAADVDRAVAAAALAFESWSQVPVEERAEYSAAISRALQRRKQQMAEVITAEMGAPISFSEDVQVGLPITTFATMAEFAKTVAWEEEVGNSLVLREPVGVVGAITPWNFPLHQIAAKIAPALVAGCTVVLKPSEVTPLSAVVLADVLDEVGLPAGVVNIVNGTGPVVGEAISGHTDIDMVTFTGSTAAGRRVGEVAADTVKRVALELGGKNANVLLPGADLERAIPNALAKGLLNSGQACLALSRLLVPRAEQAEAERIITRSLAQVRLGDPTDPDTTVGPMVNETQRQRVLGYVRSALDDGARLIELTDGSPVPTQGFFVQPLVLTDVTPEMTVAREEIFGPVITVIPYDDEVEAVQIANDTIYGLGGGVWGATAEDAQRVARRIRTGSVEINGGAYNPVAPIGGYGQSGNGREFGMYGLDEFLTTKSLQR